MDNSDAFQQLETSCHTHQSLGFIDTAFGSAANRNHVVSVGQLVIPGNRPDCYTTMYRFGEEYKQLCEETGSVRGASKQPCDCDFLWFDIDSGDLTTALVNARSLVTRIELIDPALSQHLAIYFSGSKGFHVGIPAGLFGWEPFVELPRAHRHLATGIAGDVQIDTAIYEHNRLWRVPNTRHGKSGLYKVPLTYEQLATWPIDQIKQLATRPTSRPALPDALPTPGGPHPRMRDMYMNAVQTLQARPAVSDSKPWQSSSVAPDRPCLQKLLRGVEAGRRNEAAIRLSAAFKRAGHSPEGILDELHTWNERNQPPLSADPPWKGPTITAATTPC
jgi:hypothetical protein